MRHPALSWLSMQMAPLRRLGGKVASLSEHVEGIPENAPQTISCRPALFDPDHLDRITQCAFGRTMQELVEVLRATSYVESPLTTFTLGEATVIGGMIFTNTSRILHSGFVSSSLKDTLSPGPVAEEVVLANSMQGLRYFGHWLSDDVSAFEAFATMPA